MQSVIFLIITVAAVYIAFQRYKRIWRNIRLGRSEGPVGDKGERWKNVMLIAFGQKKMFKRWVPAIFHLFIYLAFLLTQIELIEILIDGIFGVHRFFSGKIGVLYPLIINLIEVLSVGAFVATLIFLIRRNLIKVPRFHMDEMTAWPKLDGNLILYGEILLLIGIFSMNGADYLLQNLDPAHYPSTGMMAISSSLGPAIFGGLSESSLVTIERFGWWLHILVVYAFLLYLPISKHLHLILAFPNTFFAKADKRGEMENIPAIMNEVKSMIGIGEQTPENEDIVDLPEFGARDIFDLPRRVLLGAFTCTECGRCSSVCPANITGKKLSPRKIMMDIRDRVEEVGKHLDAQNSEVLKEKSKGFDALNYDDGRSLFDYISTEEIYACTTCNACVEACPVMINPVEPILELRRYEILTESKGPGDWLPMFNSIENSNSAWQIPEARDKWTIETT